jgi:hypothetical protein
MEQVQDHEMGWITVQYADRLIELARAEPNISGEALYQLMQRRSRNIIEIMEATVLR